MDNVVFSVTAYILMALLLLSLVLLFASLHTPRLKKEKLPKCQQTDFFPPRKRKLYGDLSMIADKHELEIFPQVNIGSFVRPERGAENEALAVSFLREYYADFLLCEGDAGTPLLVIIQDEGMPQRNANAETLEYICDKVGLPVMHVREYNLAGLEKALLQKAGLALPKVSLEQEAPEATAV